jgi:hypothetical protein
VLCCQGMDVRTFFDAMYQARLRVTLPLMLDIRLYVNPNAIPSFATACLSTLVISCTHCRAVVIRPVVVVVIFVDLSVDVEAYGSDADVAVAARATVATVATVAAASSSSSSKVNDGRLCWARLGRSTPIQCPPLEREDE